MALDQLPPWVDVHPRDFVAAMESGARAGEAAASLDQRKQESLAENALKSRQLGQQAQAEQAQQGFEQQKLDTGLQESAADRALKEKLSGQEMALNANKFNSGLGLDMANLNVRQQMEKRQQDALKFKEDQALTKLKLTADNAVKASDFGQRLSQTKTKEDYTKLLHDFPEIITNAGYSKAYQNKYASDFPKAGAGSVPKQVRKQTMVDGQLVPIEDITTTTYGNKSPETDHAATQQGERVKVYSQEEYDKLPPGTKGISPSGKPFTKPGNPQSPLSEAQQDDVLGLPAKE